MAERKAWVQTLALARIAPVAYCAAPVTVLVLVLILPAVMRTQAQAQAGQVRNAPEPMAAPERTQALTVTAEYCAAPVMALVAPAVMRTQAQAVLPAAVQSAWTQVVPETLVALAQKRVARQGASAECCAVPVMALVLPAVMPVQAALAQTAPTVSAL